jgi:hypothetical protein
MADGWKHWLLWQEVCLEHGYRADGEGPAMRRADAGRHLGFTRVVARRR